MNTNKTFMLAALAVASQAYSPSALAQSMTDAVRFGSSDIIGTARYRSMAGAFGALGGDPTCMSDNPAGLAIYRGTNLASITPHLGFTSTETKGSVKETGKDDTFSTSNFSIVFSFMPEDSERMVNFNVGFGLERRQQTIRKMNAVIDNPSGDMSGYLFEQANTYLDNSKRKAEYLGWDEAWSNSNVPLLPLMGYESFAIHDDPTDEYHVIAPAFDQVFQQTNMLERTRNDHYNISGAFNFGDQFYVGATVHITDFNSMIEHCFSEDSQRDMNGDFITYDNRIETKGSGIGINLGVLWKPTEQWRIGAAVHTPTWMEMTEFNDALMEAYNGIYENACIYAEQHGLMDPENWSEFNDEIEYKYQSPWEYQFSTAYVFGTRAILSLEYDLTDFKSMRFSPKYSGDYVEKRYYDDMNQTSRQYVRLQHTIKGGLEVRMLPQLSLRAGYAYKSSPYEKNALYSDINPEDITFVYRTASKLNYNTLDDQHYVTFGAGWRGKNWTFDLSCMSHSMKEYYAPYTCDYADSDILNFNTHTLNWDLTVGYRF